MRRFWIMVFLCLFFLPHHPDCLASQKVRVPLEHPPQIKIVLLGLGQSEALTRQALKELPKEIALAFVPQTAHLSEWLRKARLKGHETLITVGMEPKFYPLDDPGPGSLFIHLTREENLGRLSTILESAKDVVGIVPQGGSLFVTQKASLQPIFHDLKKRELIFFDPVIATDSLAEDIAKEVGTRYILNDDFFENAPEQIEAALERLERRARNRGKAVGAAFISPTVLEYLNNWVSTLRSKNISLTPLIHHE